MIATGRQGWLSADGRWALLAAALAFAVTAAAIEPLPVGLWTDDGLYVILARALKSGDGYRFINLPGAPPALHFPPGYPAFLAALSSIAPAFPGNVAAFVFANTVLVAIAAWGAVRLGRSGLALPPLVATLATVSWAIAVPTLMLSTAVLSETLCLALLVPALVIAERTHAKPGTRRAMAAGVLLGLATLVRSLGITAVVATALVLAYRRRWRELAAFVGVAAATLAPWIVWKARHATVLPAATAGMYGDYGAWLQTGISEHGVSMLIPVALRNTRDLVDAMGRYWSNAPDDRLRTVAGLTFLFLTAVGLAASWRRAPIVALTLLFYGAIAIVWPFPPQRFIWGVGAIWTLIAAAGGWCIWRHVRGLSRRALVGVTATLLIATALAIPVGTVRAIRTREWSAVPRTEIRSAGPMLGWVLEDTPRDAVLAADWEAFLYLYSGRQAFPFVPFKASDRAGLMTADEAYAGFEQALAAYHPQWVLAQAVASLRVAMRFSQGEGAPLRLEAVLPRGAIYRVRAADAKPQP